MEVVGREDTYTRRIQEVTVRMDSGKEVIVSMVTTNDDDEMNFLEGKEIFDELTESEKEDFYLLLALRPFISIRAVVRGKGY